MKVLINHPILLTVGDKDVCLDIIDELKEFGIRASLCITDVKIAVQKVTLGDIATNSWVSTVNQFAEGDLIFRYAALGGVGCQFALELLEIVPATQTKELT